MSIQNVTVKSHYSRCEYCVSWQDGEWRYHVWFKSGVVNNLLYKNPLTGTSPPTRKMKADSAASAAVIRRVMTLVDDQKLFEQADAAEIARQETEQTTLRQQAAENLIRYNAPAIHAALQALVRAVENNDTQETETALVQARAVLKEAAVI